MLKDIGKHKLGFHTHRYYECDKCGTRYPQLMDFRPIMCNGKAIGRCLCETTDERNPNEKD